MTNEKFIKKQRMQVFCQKCENDWEIVEGDKIVCPICGNKEEIK